MAWVSPKTWTTGSLVSAAELNEQIRDNENWLKDQFAPGSGHDHDGTDSKVIPWTNMPVAQFVTWISGADAVQTSYEGQAGRPHVNAYAEGPQSDVIDMIFPFPIPYAWAGQVVHIKEIKFYGYTISTGRWFDAIWLRRSDLAGGVTDDVTYTTDLGTGVDRNFNATIYSGDLAMTDAPYQLVVKCLGGGQYADYRVYGFRVVWEA